MSKRRILIIDDEHDITCMFQIALEANRFLVDVFNDPLLALAEYKPGTFDLLIIDLILPELDGYGLAKKIRVKDKHVKICFLTASEKYLKQYQEKYFLCEGEKYTFIQKPIEIEDLINKINQIIDGSIA
jgi:two-component system response regulator VanR